jgi:CheY-like chemotaxis protein
MSENTALIVDDSRVARITLKKLLVAQGFEIIEYGSGEEAISYLASASTLPDIIFMDVMMEGMDGLTATRQIKADVKFADTPVVICTGNDTEADIENALATGAVAVLAKPPQEEQLLSVLEAVKAAKIVAPIESPVTEAQVVEVDEQAIASGVAALIRDELIAVAQQSAREMAEDISRQVAAESASENAKAIIDAAVPEIQQQVNSAAALSVEESVTQLSKTTANEALTKHANTVLSREFDELHLKEKVSKLIEAQGSDWLAQQQKTVSDVVVAKVESQVDTYLQEKLPPLVGPIVHAAVAEALAEAGDNKQQFEILNKQISNTKTLAIGLGVVAIAVAVVTGFVL